jgi:hypothetical protein
MLEGSSRGLLGDGWMTQENSEKNGNVQGMGKKIETPNYIEIKLFVLAALKEHYLYLSLFFCFLTRCSASVIALLVVFHVTVRMKVLQIEYFVRFSKRTDGVHRNGHFVRCIQSSNIQGYNGIHELWEDFIN